MKRVVALVAALLCCTSSVFAWNAESFTNGNVYEYEPVMAVSTFSLDHGVSVASVSDSDVVDSLSYTDIISGLTWPSAYQVQISASNSLVGMSLPFFYPDSGFSLSASTNTTSTGFYSAVMGSYTFPEKVDGSVVESLSRIFSYKNGSSDLIHLPIDISSFGSFRCFSLSGRVNKYWYAKFNGVTQQAYCALYLYVNGEPVKSWTGKNYYVQMNDFIYSSTTDITSIEFVIVPDTISLDIEGGGSVQFRVSVGSDNLTLSVLRDDAVLDGFNDQAQDSINEHESVESQWTGSMTENFNALDMESFTFPDGLVSAFALITGIFQDIWNGMGEYKILYVFPLTLAIALLLVGRISKFAGNSGSGRNKGGDDGA